MGLANRIRRLFRRPTASETATGVALATLVGVAAGLGAVAFRWLISAFQDLFFDGGERLLGGLGGYYVILVPAAGGIVVGLITYFFAPGLPWRRRWPPRCA